MQKRNISSRQAWPAKKDERKRKETEPASAVFLPFAETVSGLGNSGDALLVIRTSDREIRWMDVSAYLKRESVGGRTVRQIVFEGEGFDVMSVRRWRAKVLGQGSP